jgi:hypothetical protein
LHPRNSTRYFTRKMDGLIIKSYEDESENYFGFSTRA